MNTFFPEKCEWTDFDSKGDVVYCTKPWSVIKEPELQVYCDFHYKRVLYFEKKYSQT